MKNIKKILIGFLSLVLFSACLKDNGNYNYKKITYIRILHPTYNYNTFLGDTLTVLAIRQLNQKEDSLKFDNAWYVNGDLYSTEPELKFVGKEIGSFSCKFYAIEKETGIVTAAASSFNINVTSPFSTGYTILYEKGGNSELAHVRSSNNTFIDQIDIYKSVNNNEVLGSQPIMLNDFLILNGKRGLFVMQQGGQGSVELSGEDYKKQEVTSQSFVGNAPANFKPIDIGMFATSDMIVDQSGAVYPRYFNNPIPFTTPWLSLPMKVEKGMQITQIWKSFNSLTYMFMYDKLNNRILQVGLDNPNIAGGMAVIKAFPIPIIPNGVVVPADYVSPNDLGNCEYIWGGTFRDQQYASVGAFLIKDPADQKIYLQTFSNKSVSLVFEWAPQDRMVFPGTNLVNANSKYVALKNRDYLFFSGGAGNKSLYYFDIISKTLVKLVMEFPSKINSLTMHDNGNQLAVGLDDGTFILIDVSNESIVNSTFNELHKLTGLGKIVDIVMRGSQMN